jgi:hypothetical protein
MKTFRDILNETASTFDTPVTGDAFDIELTPDELIESVVSEVDGDRIIIEADSRVMSILESRGLLAESRLVSEGIQRYGAVGNSPGMGHTVSECDCEQNYTDETPVADPGEYDTEGDMAKNELLTIIRAARKLTGMLDNDDNMPEWTQKKITKAADYVDTAADYIASQKERGVMERFAKDPGKLDLSANPTKSQVWARYMEIYDYEGYQGEENSQEMQDLEDYAAQRFGQDMVNDMMKAGYYSYFGRPDDPKKPIDQGSGNYTSLGRSPISDKDIKKSGTLNKRATAGTKDRILSRLGKHPKPALPEGQSEESSPVARAVLHRIMMAHPSMLATHGPERVMSAVDELADRVNIGPDDEIGSSDVSGWTRDVIRMLAELPDESMSDVDALDETQEMRNADGLTQTEWIQKIRAAGGKIVAQAKLPNGPVIGMLNGKRVNWQPTGVNPAYRQQAPKQSIQERGVQDQIKNRLQQAIQKILDPIEYQHQQDIQQQDREYERAIGTEARAELKQKADELAEIKRQQLRAEALEDAELAFQRAETRAEREAVMEKIKREYQHELDVINTNHRANMEAIRTGNDHEIRKMEREHRHEKDMWKMQNPSTRDRVQRPARRPNVVVDLDIDQPEPAEPNADAEYQQSRQDMFRLSGLPLPAPASTQQKKPKKFDTTDAVDADVKEPDDKRSGAPGLPGPTNEAEYQGRDVPLGKPMQGDVKKFKVYVKDPKTGNVKKVNFGDPDMRIKKSNPARRKSFRARHNCDNPGPRTKARYWSCRAW